MNSRVMDEALYEFGIAVGKLKRVFAEENNCGLDCIEIHIDCEDFATIIATGKTGYLDAYREWLCTEE